VRAGGKVLLFGNGGSAADAQHIAAELVIRYKCRSSPDRGDCAEHRHSALTACGNDLGFDAIFERQIEALGRAHDVALGISTSGNSPNVLRGLRQAKAIGLHTARALVGEPAAKCRRCAMP
jgi:D-sedoheptulose 7-phosphate isomerase